LRAGYRPVGMVMGNCVYHVAHQTFGQWFKNVGQNVEMTNFTQALYDARELAMERMQNEAEGQKAEGIVGVDIYEGNYGWSSHVIEFFVVGTAIVALSAEHHIPAPQLVLSVND
ncbi:MAG: heavy metal-binding domain-containing protein, partial [Candidatus Obscuribacterales bacterium]|nr:heavy metal-binding domain-containing protein [Candidatus Obscuribacterales bacterium]